MGGNVLDVHTCSTYLSYSQRWSQIHSTPIGPMGPIGTFADELSPKFVWHSECIIFPVDEAIVSITVGHIIVTVSRSEGQMGGNALGASKIAQKL